MSNDLLIQVCGQSQPRKRLCKTPIISVHRRNFACKWRTRRVTIKLPKTLRPQPRTTFPVLPKLKAKPQRLHRQPHLVKADVQVDAVRSCRCPYRGRMACHPKLLVRHRVQFLACQHTPDLHFNVAGDQKRSERLPSASEKNREGGECWCLNLVAPVLQCLLCLFQVASSATRHRRPFLS